MGENSFRGRIDRRSVPRLDYSIEYGAFCFARLSDLQQSPHARSLQTFEAKADHRGAKAMPAAAVNHVVVDKALSGMGRDGSVSAKKSQEMVISAQSSK